MDNDQQRDTRLDFSRALAISLVLVWHLTPIRIIGTSNHSVFSWILKPATHFFYNQITLVAVPIFLLVSIYLFYQKAETTSFVYLKKRCRRLAAVFAFWTVCQFVFFGISELGNSSYTFSSFVISLPRLLMQGGPSLPLVGGSVFYFIFVLLILVLISFVTVIFRGNKNRNIIQLINGTVVIVLLFYFEISNLKGHSIPYWRLDNFLIYVPLSYLLLRCTPERLRQFTPLMWICFVIFSLQDIYLRHQEHNLGAYCRVSIVFGSTAVFSSVLQYKNLRNFKIVSFLSKFSLGIFAIHKYLQFIVIVLFLRFGLSKPLDGMSRILDWYKLAEALTAASLTFAAVYFLGRTRIKRFMI